MKHNIPHSCCVCGCEIVVSETIEHDTYSDHPRIRYHCNGERWEKRSFLCGMTYEYSPNFSTAMIYEVCSSFSEAAKIKEEIQKLHNESNVITRKVAELNNKLYEYKRQRCISVELFQKKFVEKSES